MPVREMKDCQFNRFNTFMHQPICQERVNFQLTNVSRAKTTELTAGSRFFNLGLFVFVIPQLINDPSFPSQVDASSCYRTGGAVRVPAQAKEKIKRRIKLHRYKEETLEELSLESAAQIPSFVIQETDTVTKERCLVIF